MYYGLDCCNDLKTSLRQYHSLCHDFNGDMLHTWTSKSVFVIREHSGIFIIMFYGCKCSNLLRQCLNCDGGY